jgi:hypothetical protein
MTITPQKIKKIAAYGGFVQILVTLLVLGSCNFGTPDYRLNVIIEEGVTGTPEAGEMIQKDLSEISYEYTGIDPIHTVEVFLNDIRQTYTGTFAMYTDVTLIARLVDIRGRWSMEMQQTDPSETFTFEITFDGASLTNGTFSDSRGNHGGWTAESGVITITYPDWNFFVLTGAVFNMSGIFTVGEDKKGAWAAERL